MQRLAVEKLTFSIKKRVWSIWSNQKHEVKAIEFEKVIIEVVLKYVYRLW
jgi:hypothetical protein